MNSMFFGLKRAYYATMKGTRRPLRKLGITPARVDLLTMVARSPSETMRACLQRELRDALGVVASTLTEMLKALEKLGLVRRTYADDRRYRVVELTSRAKELLERVEQWAIKDFCEEKFLASPLVQPGGRDGVFYCLYTDAWEGVPEAVARMDRVYGSAGPYPSWHPDD